MGPKGIWVTHTCARCGEKFFTQWAATHTPKELEKIQEERLYCRACVSKIETERKPSDP